VNQAETVEIVANAPTTFDYMRVMSEPAKKACAITTFVKLA